MKFCNVQRNDDYRRSASFLVAASTSCRLRLRRSRVNKRLPKGLPGIRDRLGERFSSLSAGSSLVRDIQRQASSGLAPLGVSSRHVKAVLPDAGQYRPGNTPSDAWRKEAYRTGANEDFAWNFLRSCLKDDRPMGLSL